MSSAEIITDLTKISRRINDVFTRRFMKSNMVSLAMVVFLNEILKPSNSIACITHVETKQYWFEDKD